MVSARTSTPGCSKIFSTRPSEGAGTQRTTWGTKVPLPRTSRTIGPRLTVSITAVERSSVGAAGFSFARASVTPPTVVRPIRINIAARIRLVSFDFAFRLISMNTLEDQSSCQQTKLGQVRLTAIKNITLFPEILLDTPKQRNRDHRSFVRNIRLAISLSGRGIPFSERMARGSVTTRTNAGGSYPPSLSNTPDA